MVGTYIIMSIMQSVLRPHIIITALVILLMMEQRLLIELLIGLNVSLLYGIYLAIAKVIISYYHRFCWMHIVSTLLLHLGMLMVKEHMPITISTQI